MDATRHREQFAELVRRDPNEVPLDRAALLIAAEEYRTISIDAYVEKLDELAERVATRVHRDAGPHETLNQMRLVLVEQEGFSGNTDQYYDPRNSFLNEVLDRRVGIPIALSTVYMEVGRRIGFSLKGVGYPGHFLVKHPAADGDIVIDPFHRARIMNEDELQSRLDTCFGGRVRHQPALLRAVTTHELLFRMLSNLKSIYVRTRDTRRALAVVERLLILDPDDTRELRDRGVMLAQLDRPFEALSVLAHYREREPNADDGEQVDELMEQLRLKVGMAN